MPLPLRRLVHRRRRRRRRRRRHVSKLDAAEVHRCAS